MPPVNRIALAIGTGVLLGCIFGFLFPKQYFLLDYHSKSATIINIDSSLCALSDRVVLSKADYNKLQFHTTTVNLRQQLPKSAAKTVDKSHRKLAKMLKTVAIKKELIVSIITDPPHTNILEIFFNSIKTVGITNYIAVVFDNTTADFCKSKNVTFYYYTGNYVADLEESTVRLKLSILKYFLQIGYNVVYSDVDIIYLQNPFLYLYRDTDVELMSNGHNSITAYGFSEDKVKIMSIGAYNSGFFYIRSGITSIKLLDRVAIRVSESKSYEVAFNEELFLPSSPGYFGLHASKRIMDFDMFTNNKVIFQKELGTYSKKMPIIVQVSHMDIEHKLRIMKAVVDFYVHGKNDSLQPFSFPYGFD